MIILFGNPKGKKLQDLGLDERKKIFFRRLFNDVFSVATILRQDEAG